MRFHPQFRGPIEAHHFAEPWWHGFLGWFIPLLLVALVVGLVVWAVFRMTGPNRLALAGAGWSGPARRADAALDLVRTRYARGEISRDEFVQLSSDLGEPPAQPPPPAEGQPSA